MFHSVQTVSVPTAWHPMLQAADCLKSAGADASGAGSVRSFVIPRPSMSIDTATVRHIAKLARIAVSDAEAEAMVPELNNIIGWIEQLQEVDVSGVEPMTAVIPNKLRLRDDIVTDGDKRDDVLANAPVAERGFFAVPKVIE